MIAVGKSRVVHKLKGELKLSQNSSKMRQNLKLNQGIKLVLAASFLQVLVVVGKPSSIELESSNETTKDTSLGSQLDTMVNVANLRPASLASEHSPTIDTTAYLIKESTDLLHDQLVQAMATDLTNQSAPPSNHKNYPVEPFPSASYNFLMTSSANPSPANISGGMTTTNSHQLATGSFLNRDHHQSPGSISQTPVQQHHHQSREMATSENANSNPPNQSFSTVSSDNNQHGTIGRNTAENTGIADSSSWHNYAGSMRSALNTGLIQNLTASMFPIKQLSNFTLLTLSELLNKSKPTTYQLPGDNSNLALSTFEYKPTSYNLGHLSSVSSMFGSSMRHGSALDGGVPSLMRFDQNSMMPSEERFRPSGLSFAKLSPERAQTSSTQMSLEDPFAKQTNMRSFSGLFNPFTPPSSKDLALMNAVPPQGLDSQSPLSVSLYSSYLTEPSTPSDYQSLPTISVNNLRQYFDGQNLSPVSPVNFGMPTLSQSLPPMQDNNDNNLSFQLNQNKGANLQQQLTPFKPSVVNPPQSSLSDPANNLKTSNSIQISHQHPTNSNQLDGRDRLSLGDTNEDKTFGSFALGSSNNHIRPAAYQQQTTKTTNRLIRPNDNHQNHKASLNDDFDPSTFNNVTAFHLLNSDKNPILASSTNRSETALLFDLYEREVDKQIRDALYANQQAFLQEPTLSSASKSAASWFDKTSTGDVYSDEGINDLFGWTRPLSSPSSTSFSTHPSIHPILNHASQSPISTTTSHAWPATRDYLTAAVQDLPTFGGTDFQPLLATTQSYSLFPFQSYQDTSDSNQLASVLATQLLAQDEPTEIYKPPPKVTPPKSTTTSTSSSSLPSFLMKLNSSPLTSVFSTPLSQLYASLNPLKGRNKKQQAQQQQHQQQQQQGSGSGHYNQASAANTMVLHQPSNHQQPTKNLISSLASPVNMAYRTAIKLKGQQHQQQVRQNHNTNQHRVNQQRLMMARLLAAAASGRQLETSLMPLQATLLQSQLSSNPALSSYLTPETSPALGLTDVPSLFDQSSASNLISESSAENSNSPTGMSNALHNLPPLIWRNILSQTNWARKQSTAPTLASSHSGSNHQATTQVSPSSSTFYSQPFQHLRPTLRLSSAANLLNHKDSLATGGSSLLNTNLANYLFNNNNNNNNHNHQSALMKQQTTNTNNFVTTTRQQPKLAIKILKIPVALYDAPSTSSNTVSDLSQVASGPSVSHFVSNPQLPVSLAHLFTSHLNCPLHHPIDSSTAILNSFSQPQQHQQQQHRPQMIQSQNQLSQQFQNQLRNSLDSAPYSSIMAPPMSATKQQLEGNDIISSLTTTTTVTPVDLNQQSSGILTPSTIASVIGSQISASDLVQDPNSSSEDLQTSSTNLERKLMELIK